MADNLERLVVGINKYDDILLVLLIVAIVTLMIMPVPTPLLDTLIAINLGLSVILLMVANYIRSPLSFSVFPTLLLFTTLFKLALNITSTRLILLHADAGKIIQAFGEFVVGGNFVVGVVIFLILTIVQFIVLAKGAERVAEVTARFTLDAMPGKQMSIDADLRSGGIDIDEARRRREEITTESKFFGAMDGAMKFVKGDAVAAILIVFVNIVAGLIIGITQLGMSSEEALHTYSVLSIGDGLVSQIPAILICMTAGVITTRVSDNKSQGLGADIGRQIMNQPKALAIGSGVLALMALVPGFPKIQFGILAVITAILSYALLHARKAAVVVDPHADLAKTMAPSADAGPPPKPASMDDDTQAEEPEDNPVAVPLGVVVSSSLQSRFTAEELNVELKRVRHSLFQDLGVPFPGITFSFEDSVKENSYSIVIYEIPVASGMMSPGNVFVQGGSASIAALGFHYTDGEQFLPRNETVWVDENQVANLERAGISYLTLPKVITCHLSHVLSRYGGEFVGLQETKFLLDKFSQWYPDLANEAQRIVSLEKLSEILKRLVQENISIRNFKVILQSLMEWAPKEKETVMLTEYIRGGLKRQISYQYTDAQNMLSAYILDPSVEKVIRDSIRQTSTGSFLALPPETSRVLMGIFKDKVGDLSVIQAKPVVLCSLDIRRYVRKLIETDLYDLPVLSYQELVDEVIVQPLGRISLD